MSHNTSWWRSETFWDVSLTVIIGLFLRFVVLGFPIQVVLVEFVLDGLIVIAVVGVVIGRKLLAFRGLIQSLLLIHEHKDVRHPIIRFLEKTVKDIEITLAAAFSKDGVAVTLSNVDFVARQCFHFGNGVYHGTDSNVPSEFKKQYPEYLRYHEHNTAKAQKPGFRVVIVTQQAMLHDYNSNKHDCITFLQWHASHTIFLLQIDPDRALELSKDAGISVTDIGIWDSNLAVLFGPIQAAEKKIIVRDNTSEEFAKCQDYFLLLLREANKIDWRLETTLSFRARNQAEREEDIASVKSQWKLQS